MPAAAEASRKPSDVRVSSVPGSSSVPVKTRLPPGPASVRLEEVEAHFDATWFSWIGDFGEAAPFYYRVHSPVIFIEFYHQPGVALPNAGYNRRHAHALVRTPNGNDYGRALLRQYRGLA